MSLVRNLTKRARAHTRGEENVPRSCAVKYAPGTINRAKISLPTELISTTNVDALNAPDIRQPLATPSKASSSSDSINSDNDFSSIDKGFLSADNSSTADLSPITPLTPMSDIGALNDTKDFFSSKSTVGITSSAPAADPVPAIPTRAPSHSKKAHVERSNQLSFKRSLSPPPTDIAKPSQQPMARSTPAMFSSPTSTLASPERISHPFSRELGKVDEVAESFSPAGTGMVLDEEEQEMMAKGLRKFTVSDYVAEITGMTGGVFEDKMILNPWI